MVALSGHNSGIAHRVWGKPAESSRVIETAAKQVVALGNLPALLARMRGVRLITFQKWWALD
ncbi:hypothetical protein NXC24_PB00423 (plasmid) [Rhizobium sp. NXC24]|nr:hypothetical protein NXC24_PB00423 [Rhizobium sp. NXC24]